MGMFDKDKQYGLRLDDEYGIGDPFILYAASVDGETVETSLGDAEVARLVTATIDKPEDHIECTTFASAIVDKVKEAERGDFPAVVKLKKVTSTKYGTEALVLRFVRPWQP